tara:strand:- start:558 stop:773 length:216 start_codon:yes stop_codon:yes gene_type:complete
MQVSTEHRVNGMPLEYFQLPEMQDKFDSLHVRSFSIGEKIHCYYVATIILDEESNEKTTIMSQTFYDYVKD